MAMATKETVPFPKGDKERSDRGIKNVTKKFIPLALKGTHPCKAKGRVA